MAEEIEDLMIEDGCSGSYDPSSSPSKTSLLTKGEPSDFEGKCPSHSYILPSKFLHSLSNRGGFIAVGTILTFFSRRTVVVGVLPTRTD
jgi:hypothetical protein